MVPGRKTLVLKPIFRLSFLGFGLALDIDGFETTVICFPTQVLPNQSWYMAKHSIIDNNLCGTYVQTKKRRVRFK